MQATQPISADSHVVEAESVFAGLPERFGDDAPRVVFADTRLDAIVIPSRGLRSVHPRKASAGIRTEPGATIKHTAAGRPVVDELNVLGDKARRLANMGYSGLRMGLRDGARRHEDQDEDGVAAEVLYPGYFDLFNLENTDLLVACQRNYNDWLGDYTGASRGRLRGLAAIPVQCPEAAVRELRRVLKKGFKGGCIPCVAPTGRPYRDRRYDPIWALAAEANFPLSLHISTSANYLDETGVPPLMGVDTGAKIPRQRPEPLGGELSFLAAEDYAASHTAIQRTLVDLICGGVAARHPRLKFVICEFNAGWIAHWLDRLERGISHESAMENASFSGASPREIWRRQFYATIEDDRAAVLTRELLGVENLMWASDYPHADSTWPCSSYVLGQLFDGIPESDRTRIVNQNVKGLYWQ